MSENEVYEPAEEGITLRKVGYFFKKGWLRMIVYVLVAVVVAAIVALPIRSFYKSEKVGTISIEYIYDGVEKGEDPNGGMLDTDNIISMVVLNNAVNAAGLSGTLTDISALRAAMRVDGVETEEYARLSQAAANGDESAKAALRNYKMHSTSFDIIISEPKRFGLSDTQTKQLLDKVYTSYCADFKRRFSVGRSFDSDIFNLSDNAIIEYADIYDTYLQSFETIDSYLASLASKSHGANDFAVIRNEITQINLALGTFNNHVVSNNIWRDIELAKSSLTENASLLEKRAESLQNEYDALHEIVINIKPVSIKTETLPSGATTTTSVYPDYYADYLQLEVEKLEQLRSIRDRLGATQQRLEKVNQYEAPVTDEDKQKEQAAKDNANRLLENLEESAEKLVIKVNAEIAKYADSQYVAQSVKLIRPATVTNKTISFSLTVVFGCAALLGLLVACIVTGVKIAKAKTAVAGIKADEDQAAESEPDKKSNKE